MVPVRCRTKKPRTGGVRVRGLFCKHCAPRRLQLFCAMFYYGAISSTALISSYVSGCKVTCCTFSYNRRSQLETEVTGPMILVPPGDYLLPSTCLLFVGRPSGFSSVTPIIAPRRVQAVSKALAPLDKAGSGNRRGRVRNQISGCSRGVEALFTRMLEASARASCEPLGSCAEVAERQKSASENNSTIQSRKTRTRGESWRFCG